MSRVTKLKKLRQQQKLFLDHLETEKFRESVRDRPADYNPYEPRTSDSKVEGGLTSRLPNYFTWQETLETYVARLWGPYAAKIICTKFKNIHRNIRLRKSDKLRIALIGVPESELVYDHIKQLKVWYGEKQHDTTVVVRGIGEFRVGFNYVPDDREDQEKGSSSPTQKVLDSENQKVPPKVSKRKKVSRGRHKH